MTRQQVALRPPTDEAARQVPVTRRSVPLHRCVHARHAQPHWFSSRDDNPAPGRFDLASPNGTSYYGRTAAAALLEVLADPDESERQPLTRQDLAHHRLWTCTPEGARARRLADATVASVPGLTAELATVVPYDLPWAWADALHALGRAGLVYTARFTQGECVALFGPAGPPNEDDASPAHGDATSVPAADAWTELPPAWRSDATGGHTPVLASFDLVEDVPRPDA